MSTLLLMPDSYVLFITLSDITIVTATTHTRMDDGGGSGKASNDSEQLNEIVNE